MGFIIGRIKQILCNLAYSVCRRIKDFNFPSADNRKEDLQQIKSTCITL